MNIRGIGLWLVLSLTCTLIPNVSFAQAVTDNPSVTAQLNATRTIVAIKKDAAKMQSYSRSKLDWQTHSAVLEQIKADVNKLQENMRVAIAPERSQPLATGCDRPNSWSG